MRPFRTAHGIATGLIAAAATGGALVGFGLRFGTPARPFNALAGYILGPATLAIWQFSFVTIVGIAVHVIADTLVGVAFVALVARVGRTEIGWALLLAATAFGISWASAGALGVGLGTLLSIRDRIVLGVVLAAALPLGMRFALSVLRRD